MPNNKFHDVTVVLLAGGGGTRFWPLSTPARPKQFLTELTPRSLYQQAVERARLLAPPERILVLTNEAFAGFVAEQSPEIPPANVVLEPLRRDTAAALILGAVLVERLTPGNIMVAMPSDHLVRPLDAFRATLDAAVTAARDGGLGTIGITPTYPATGYGYLLAADRPQSLEPMPVEKFVEKPDRPRAEQYVASGRYFWNSGLFVWRAAALLEAAARLAPAVYGPLAGLGRAFGSPAFPAELRSAFEAVQPISIDYAIMENSTNVWLVPAAFQWSDVGGWSAALELLPAAAHGNHVSGLAVLHDVADSVVLTDADHPVIVVGLSGYVVIRGPGGILVCPRDRVDQIKPLVEQILRR
jgi:mannose-1-phosphate guanylyltransferase